MQESAHAPRRADGDEFDAIVVCDHLHLLTGTQPQGATDRLWDDDLVFRGNGNGSAGVVAAIEPSVRQAEIERAKRKRPESLDAYDLYLRALEQSYVYTPAARLNGLTLLDAAIALEPEYAEAHGVAAFCLQQRYLFANGLGFDSIVADLRRVGFPE